MAFMILDAAGNNHSIHSELVAAIAAAKKIDGSVDFKGVPIKAYDTGVIESIEGGFVAKVRCDSGDVRYISTFSIESIG